MTCIIVDDEIDAIQVLERYISKTPGLTLLNTYSNPLNALQAPRSDIAFIDIDMPQLSGLSLASLLDVKVVFTTSYREYGPEAYEKGVVGYLLKPFTYEQFLNTVQKLRQGLSLTYAFIKTPHGSTQVHFKELIYISALLNYVELFADRKIITHTSLSEFEQLLPNHFIRIHRSYIVNLHQVRSTTNDELTLSNGKTLTIGRSFRAAFLERLARLTL